MYQRTRRAFVRQMIVLAVLAVVGWIAFIWVFQHWFPDDYDPAARIRQDRANAIETRESMLGRGIRSTAVQGGEGLLEVRHHGGRQTSIRLTSFRIRLGTD